MAEFTLAWGDPVSTRAICGRLTLPWRSNLSAGAFAAALWFDDDPIPEAGACDANDERVFMWAGDADGAAWLLESLERDRRRNLPGDPASALERQAEALVARVPGVLSGCFFFRASGLVVAFGDRAGLLPVYLRHHASSGSVLSTVAPHVWRAGERAPTPSVTQLSRFLRIVDDDSGEDFVRNVTWIRPGELVRVPAGLPPERRRYWHLDPRDEGPEGAVVEGFRAVFDRAVARAASMGRPFVSMSGGLDSTSIAATLALQVGASPARPLEVVSMIFPERPACDESRELDELERALPLRVHRFDLDSLWPAQDLSFLSDLVGRAGPWAHPGAEYEIGFRRLMVERLGVVDLVTGLGGDQLLGVPRTRLLRSLRQDRNWTELVHALREGSFWLRSRTLVGLLADDIGIGSSLRRAWASARRLAPRDAQSSASWVRTTQSEPDPAPPVPPRSEREYRLRKLTGREWQQVGRMVREAGRVARHRTYHPYLDHELWEYAAKLRPEMLMAERTRKGLLRAAMAGRLPDAIRLRPKHTNFDKHVEKGLGILGVPHIRNLFRSSRLADMGIIDGGAFLAAYDEYCAKVRSSAPSGREVGSMFIWRTLTSELWLRAIA